MTVTSSICEDAPTPRGRSHVHLDDTVHLGELWAVQAGDELAGAWSHRHELLVQCHCLIAPNVPVDRDRVIGDVAARKEGAGSRALQAFLGSAGTPTPMARTKPEPQGLLAFAST